MFSSKPKRYFKEAKDWYFDRYESAEMAANRWFMAFLAAFSVVLLLVGTLFILLPLKTLVPIVIHQNTKTGEVWVSPPKTLKIPPNSAEVEADITHYIIARENYFLDDLNERFHEVLALSNSRVAKTYVAFESTTNSASLINQLGRRGSRTVHIEDVVFLDRAGTHEIRPFPIPSENLAKVDFTTETTDKAGIVQEAAWVATLSWDYRGLPSTQEAAWMNWNGFTVTHYHVEPRVLLKTEAPSA